MFVSLVCGSAHGVLTRLCPLDTTQQENKALPACLLKAHLQAKLNIQKIILRLVLAWTLG